jgi:hypothetical protein
MAFFTIPLMTFPSIAVGLRKRVVRGTDRQPLSETEAERNRQEHHQEQLVDQSRIWSPDFKHRLFTSVSTWRMQPLGVTLR